MIPKLENKVFSAKFIQYMHLERSKERNKPVFLNSQTRYVAASLVTDTQIDRTTTSIFLLLYQLQLVNALTVHLKER